MNSARAQTHLRDETYLNLQSANAFLRLLIFYRERDVGCFDIVDKHAFRSIYNKKKSFLDECKHLL